MQGVCGCREYGISNKIKPIGKGNKERKRERGSWVKGSQKEVWTEPLGSVSDFGVFPGAREQLKDLNQGII